MKKLMIKIKNFLNNKSDCPNMWFENYKHLYFKTDNEIKPWYCVYKT